MGGPRTLRVQASSGPPAAPKGRRTSVQALVSAGQEAAVRAAALALTVAQLTSIGAAMPPAAEALLSSPKTQIARTPDAALRRSVPAFNPVLGEAQSKMEDIAYLLRIPQRKPWDKMAKEAEAVTSSLRDADLALAGLPEDKRAEGEELLLDIEDELRRARVHIDAQDADRLSVRLAEVLALISRLEILEAPSLSFSIPSRYDSLPRLTGRATVEMTVCKG